MPGAFAAGRRGTRGGPASAARVGLAVRPDPSVGHHGGDGGVRATTDGAARRVSGRLVAVDLPGGMPFVDVLRDVWDAGDAAFPVDQRLPHGAKAALLATMAA